MSNKIKIIRNGSLAKKIVIVDGQPGCGKTMLSPIISSMNRVELLSYAFEIEFICRLFYLEKIKEDAAISMIQMLSDHKLYQTMMGRDTNFRFSDQSSVFKDSNPFRYLKRIFQSGDESIPNKINQLRPILNLTTHNLLSVSNPIRSGLNDRVLLIEVVRHPLFMIIQQELNMINLLENPRDIDINIEHCGKALPWYAAGFEDKFLNGTAMDKVIYSIQRMTQLADNQRNEWRLNNPLSIITIPFERFVIDPYPYLSEIEEKLGTTISTKTKKVMTQQKVPRNAIADGPDLKIYRRCGWVPPISGNEDDELRVRREYASKECSSEALEILDQLSKSYRETYLLNSL